MSSKNRDIYYALNQDHQEVKRLFKQILEEREPNEEVYSRIENALSNHMTFEEENFYPRLKQGEEITFMTNEGIVAHQAAKNLIDDIADTNMDDEMWIAKVKVLSDLVNHHIEEEEGELFPEARKVLDEDEAKELGQRFMEEKDQVMKAQA